MENHKKVHVGLIFGGNSSEHDVSKRSAHNIFDAMDKDKYDVSLFLVTKDGYFLGTKASTRVFDGEPEDDVARQEIAKLDKANPLAPVLNLGEDANIDVFFPIIHGNLGEDGTIQGLLRLLGKPYVGSGVLGSAMSFDKDITKKILKLAGVATTRYELLTPLTVERYSYQSLSEELGSTLFVKPANQGSSVGIHKVENAEEYSEAIRDAFRYDSKVLVEEAIEGPEELEISVLGNNHPIASKVGAIKVPATDAFYTYDNKFVDASQVKFDVPVDISEDLAQKLTKMALDSYRALGLKGMARIDFLVSQAETPYVSEVNTLPGFTNISLYPQLFAASGISYSDLIDRLILLANEEHERQSKILYDFKPLPPKDQNVNN
ncbi:D-alanine--D-alanine ligase [Lentilactobacillus parafarraginis]|jgi:D-alanine-D-alanine ligase|uniref:D-alanine--D-alanine ligase n=2 Tax=Lentilactobacillus parafarraginis TaxID=390842 RepID=A0A0R1YRV9_9LACO|nr:D-alanine--D-alanine ligase family protein [Lentilactobacillus parafarraginis]KRM45326.1 D-ala D-ala ligase protein [Lentilactobacillus parafarraginis DSM 18390 = JCM 14109]TLQ20095.1 D-alanine--D-alanine ligase [Lentilactobacillus parafarraginis]